MKKLFMYILTILILICFSVVAFAGSVPEDLLYEDFAQVFFAEVKEYETKITAEDSYINVIPVKAVKGDINIGNEVIYEHPYPIGDFIPQKGYAYLIAYFDENNPAYIFRVSDYNTQNLRLIDIKNDNNMWNRFEEYLNNGKYEKAEEIRKAETGIKENDLQITEKLPKLHTQNQSFILTRSLGFIFVLVTICFFIYYKNRIKKRK